MIRTLAGLLAATFAGLAALLAFGSQPLASAATTHAGRAGDQARHVVVIGVPGLAWSDISARRTPAIWRLARTGSVASLAVTTIHTLTCPADAWLTLNSGNRAAQRPAGQVRCPPVRVISERGPAQPGLARAADVPAMASEISYNARFSYRPYWGVLAGASPGCQTAIGQGAALALASRTGVVSPYVPTLPGAIGAGTIGPLLRQCPLTVISLPGALAAADRAVASIVAAAPPAADIVLAGLGDTGGAPRLRTLIVSGPCCRAGLLTSASTRQPGIVAITDLTPSILHWLGAAAAPSPPAWAAPLAGTQVTSGARSALPAAIRTLIGQDTADQVYRSIVGWFFLIYGVGEAVIFAVIAVALRGGDDRGRRRTSSAGKRRVAWYTSAGAFGAAVPAGTFLAGLAGWEFLPHPAVWLYGLGLVLAALIAVPAVTGPWRHQPFGPPGFVCAVTLAVIGADVMTGSRLQLGAPFGLSLVEAGRFYGVGNNALGVYAVAAMLTAAWAAGAAARISRRRAVAAAVAVAVVSVVVLGWPAFGAKVGGTIAIVPAFCVLLAAVAGVAITLRRGLLIAVSGVVVITVFAVLDYLFPGIGHSHLGTFVGSAGHGGTGALSTLHRKISSNLHSLTEAWFTPAVPVVAVVTGAMLAWPARLRLRTFVAACHRSSLLRATLFATWLAVMLGWLAEDSGVSVVAAALPVALPLSIVLTVRTANLPEQAEQQQILSQLTGKDVATGRIG